jgi:uridine monophosphate synthetase
MPDTSMRAQDEALALEFLEVGAIRFGSFRLKLHEKNPQAPLSPIYVDLRVLRSFPATVGRAVKAYAGLATGLEFDFVADVPTAATPLVAVFSHESGVPMVSPRLDRKTHGLFNLVDGSYRKGQVTLLIDDIITLADSKLATIAVLEEAGLVVQDVLVLVDREQGGIRALSERGYSCRSVFTLRCLISLYASKGRITREAYEETLDYLGKNS